MLYNSPVFAKSPELQQQLPSTVPFFAQQVMLTYCHLAVILLADNTCSCWILMRILDAEHSLLTVSSLHTVTDMLNY